MSLQKIDRLNELLRHFLGQNKIVTNYETTRLTATGENYGSLILALKVGVKNGEKKETIEAVAKLPPPGEFMQRMFNTPRTFRNEMQFYKIILPELRNFIEERGIDVDLECFPTFYGGRLSLSEDNDYADENAIVLLENLKIPGYTIVDRTTGFDLKTTKVVLKALAKLHAVPLAMKLLKPDAFKKKIKSLFSPYSIFPMDDTVLNSYIAKLTKVVEYIEDCKQYSCKVENALKASTQFNLPKNSPEYIKEPFATIIHADAWVNNFMIKFVSGEPTDCKIVDFQLYEYGSPARDLIFFIFTSVQIPVVQEHYDHLIDFYHKNFVEILEKFNCDTSPFSSTMFQEEILRVCKDCEFFHCVEMLEPILATKDSVKELDEYKEQDLIEYKKISPKHKERAAFIVKEFIKRNLIKI